MKQLTLDISTACTNLNEIKELLGEVATLSIDKVNININYLPQMDLSSLGEQLRNSRNVEKQSEH